ncbi:MBL fold metallo-hydrolase [Cystobacter ferrugineus]|uniref:MBL fold hydrolase n=1 Tax=Cystobacter ferrugineus TaxID=83449 RepID=A0A1L9B503_9BACT|nr:MBL fold metallo-hydrolase [Cystobacter ferrugineus]OJH37290.1 MBL fold hydrolase [Cystobacter ferrugineus]
MSHSSRLLCLAATLTLAGCTATSHLTQASALGRASRSSELLAVIDQPGPIEARTVRSTRWAVPRAGLINLEHPQAKQAGLTDGDEPIEVDFHVIQHPRFGTFLIDTGVERALRDAPDKAAIRGLVARELHAEKMDFAQPLGDWLSARSEPVAGVFFTHLHLDHVSGAPDLPKTTPLYAGPGETTPRGVLNVFTRGSIDRALAGLPPVSEWGFTADADGRFAGVVDVFGDGSFYALWTPGHTPGSTAYLARTTEGPVLFTGDTSHTVWGWEHDVEPGTFTADHAANAKSLAALRALVREHPAISVRLGHQSPQ